MTLGRLFSSSPLQLDLGLLVVRAWFGLVLAFGHGIGKMTALSSFAEKVAAQGLPAPTLLATLAALSEFVGGLLLALGLLTRAAALAVLGTMLVAAFYTHSADPFAKKELALCYGAAAFALLLAGSGRLGVDGWLASRGARASG